MRYDQIPAANAALEATADHMEQLGKHYESEAEKVRGIAKNLRALASKEALPGDPKIEPKPSAPFSLPKLTLSRAGENSGGLPAGGQSGSGVPYEGSDRAANG